MRLGFSGGGFLTDEIINEKEIRHLAITMKKSTPRNYLRTNGSGRRGLYYSE